MLYRFFRPIIFLFTPEFDHHLVGFFLSLIHQSRLLTKLTCKLFKVSSAKGVEVAGINFPSRVGMAAGFDKNGTFYNGIAALGAGFVEVGSVTLTAQSGNPKPRVKRLIEDEAIINHMGLNNVGVEQAQKSLSKVQPIVPIGINIAPNHGLTTKEMIQQMTKSVEVLESAGDFFVLNLSCPNQDGVTSLQDAEIISQLLDEIETKKPIFLKFSSDLPDEKLLESIAQNIERISGVVMSNTTTTRESLKSKNQKFVGGLSGKPLFNKTLKQVKLVRQKFPEDLAVIHSGGIFTARDVKESLAAGADLVEIYTALIYQGPTIFKEIQKKIA